MTGFGTIFVHSAVQSNYDDLINICHGSELNF